ncbi:hypothetical protein [Stieleria varia]|uniref:Uncharacterized protein n=1 Tax=Stieleria varia TaxID=2528005 RepID=A0A5C6A3F5_9BACT|nr:hypothetical protein [Stieleria varia]TWT93936.1 hypothetical protein Pla52n_57640 [Stieleria varia]
MLKKILFAVVPMLMIAGTVSADNDLLNQLASMNDNGITASAPADVDTDDKLGQADVDALLGDEDNGEDAVAACFRRVGYGYGRSYGHSYGYRSYGYSSCYSPCYSYYTPSYYSYSYCRPTYYYTPVVTHYTPVYTSYWGCY